MRLCPIGGLLTFTFAGQAGSTSTDVHGCLLGNRGGNIVVTPALLGQLADPELKE